MYGREVSEVWKTKGWADIQGNSLGCWPLPWSLSDPCQDEGVQHTQEEIFLEQYNSVITGVCLHPRKMYRDSGYPKRREICRSDGSFTAPLGYSWYPTAMCHPEVSPSPAVRPKLAAAKRSVQSSVLGGDRRHRAVEYWNSETRLGNADWYGNHSYPHSSQMQASAKAESHQPYSFTGSRNKI